jgi:hypothetical protein
MSRRWRQGAAAAAAANIEPEEIVSRPHRRRMSSRPRASSKRKKIRGRRRRRLSDEAVIPATYFPAAAFSCRSFESGCYRRRRDSPRRTGTSCRRRRHLY